MKKGVLLYTCYNGYSNTKYHTPTDRELDALLEVTEEILFIPIATYNRFTDREGNEVSVLSHEAIEAMTEDMVGDPSRLDTIKKEYHATAAHRLPANYHVKDYVEDSTLLAKRITAKCPDAKLWFSVPSAENFHALTHLFATPWADTVDLIKNTVPKSIWEHNVQGIYYAGEDIITAGYTRFDFSAPDQNFGNPQVYAMKTVSDRVRSFGKKMLWIPYYHEAASSSKNLGYTVNLTDIFDVVIIQPSLFFNKAREDEIKIVAQSVEKQAVLDIDGNIIGGKKTSKTEIGFEMEIDSQFFADNAYKERYYRYEKSFLPFVGKHPTAYYAGAPETMIRVLDVMDGFFN